MPTTALAQALTADRQRLGLSQQELAKRMGVSQQSVSKWEDGSSAPRGKRLKQLVSVLGKKSQTAEKVQNLLGEPAHYVTPATPQSETMPNSTAEQIKAEAAHALAQAAKQIALAAQALAESAEKLAAAAQDPTTKH